jgi:hypothetical protein
VAVACDEQMQHEQITNHSACRVELMALKSWLVKGRCRIGSVHKRARCAAAACVLPPWLHTGAACLLCMLGADYISQMPAGCLQHYTQSFDTTSLVSAAHEGRKQ